MKAFPCCYHHKSKTKCYNYVFFFSIFISRFLYAVFGPTVFAVFWNCLILNGWWYLVDLSIPNRTDAKLFRKNRRSKKTKSIFYYHNVSWFCASVHWLQKCSPMIVSKTVYTSIKIFTAITIVDRNCLSRDFHLILLENLHERTNQNYFIRTTRTIYTAGIWHGQDDIFMKVRRIQLPDW